MDNNQAEQKKKNKRIEIDMDKTFLGLHMRSTL